MTHELLHVPGYTTHWTGNVGTLLEKYRFEVANALKDLEQAPEVLQSLIEDILDIENLMPGIKSTSNTYASAITNQLIKLKTYQRQLQQALAVSFMNTS